MSKNSVLPSWLKKTQHNSWEPEIFISGIVLFGLIQLPQYLQEFRFYFSREIFGISNDIDNLVAIMSTSIQWMIIGLVLHLFFRGVWIGLVGLSYVFPNGINHDRLNYKGKFENKIKLIPDFTNQIIRLEKISSSIFSSTYLIFMCIIGAYFYLVAMLIIPFYLFLLLSDYTFADLIRDESLVGLINIYAILVMLVGLIYMVDFLSLGVLKRSKRLNKIFYPLYQLISFITFSALYRNIYYLLVSNFKRWKVVTFLVSFIVITFFMINFNASRDSLSSNFSRLELFSSSIGNYSSSEYYASMNPSDKYQKASIQSDIVSEDVLRLFITHQVNFEDSVKANCNYVVPEESSDINKLKLECLQSFYIVNVNDSIAKTSKWMFHKDPSTGHRGIMTYVDISHLERGLHKLDIDLKNWFHKKYVSIPFYVD